MTDPASPDERLKQIEREFTEVSDKRGEHVALRGLAEALERMERAESRLRSELEALNRLITRKSKYGDYDECVWCGAAVDDCARSNKAIRGKGVARCRASEIRAAFTAAPLEDRETP